MALFGGGRDIILIFRCSAQSALKAPNSTNISIALLSILHEYFSFPVCIVFPFEQRSVPARIMICMTFP
jgi:hypothetical protein